ncbi:predicted protein [Uncinocarpus reesii 1704]|uniref:Uncharacterized protein n=1 Tax=Uncinocarpus reesii (strain UAMH 1704) TaxID=336963 RepID=C4JGF8_UNCRE|nr:uncharacterized protein UREG_01149 [Uncinocarpus reesii 1704]EEP76300.1 predicted protein [Uncinocarpus reesii 1704]
MSPWPEAKGSAEQIPLFELLFLNTMMNGLVEKHISLNVAARQAKPVAQPYDGWMPDGEKRTQQPSNTSAFQEAQISLAPRNKLLPFDNSFGSQELPSALRRSLRRLGLRHLLSMPSILSQPAPQSKAVTGRPPLDDELYVMERYASHAVHCAPCAHPYTTIRRGQSLCSRGARHVTNMAQYIYSRDGKAYSVATKDRGQAQEIAIPSRFAVIAELMRAFEYGLKVKKAQAVVIHDKRNDTQELPSTPVQLSAPKTPAIYTPKPATGIVSNTQLVRQNQDLQEIGEPEKRYNSPRIKTPGQYLR